MSGLKINTTALKLLENDFEEVIRSLSNDKKFKEFKRHYERMLQTLKVSHQREKELSKNCQELNQSIAENAGKIKAVLSIAQTDSQNIANLKKELLEAKNILIIQKEKDEISKKKIENLTKMWKNLEIITKQNQELNSGKMNEYQCILKEKKLLEDKKTELEELNGNLESKLKILKEDKEKCEILMNKNKYEYKKLEKIEGETQIQLEKNEERLMNNTYEIEKTSLAKKISVQAVEDEKNSFKLKENKLEGILEEVKISLDKKRKLEKEIVTINRSHQKQNDLLEKLHSENDFLLENKENLDKNIKVTSNEYNVVSLKNSQQDRIENKLKLETLRYKSETDKISKNQIIYQNMFEEYFQKIEEVKKSSNNEKKKLQILYSNHESIRKQYENLVMNSENLIDQIKKVLIEKKAIFEDIDPLKERIHELEKVKKISKNSRDKIVKEINQFHNKIKKIKEKLLLRDNIINESQKKALEGEIFLKDQQKLYESVRIDRNNYSKNLKETQDEIAEIKKKLKITNNQIDQLREEFKAKEKALFREISKTEELEKEFKNLDKRNEILKQERNQRRTAIKNFYNKIGKLNALKAQIGKTIKEKICLYEKIMINKDIYLTQLVRKNDEIALLKERVGVQESTFVLGQKEFQKRENELNFLTILIKDLEHELEINKKKIKKVFLYKENIKEVSENLLEEKLKVKALSEELENPINVNRWRSIGENDQDIYELMGRIHHFQKKLIMKTEEIISQDLKITSNINTIKNFEEIFKKNPGIKEAKKFSLLQKSLRGRIRKLKAIAAELNLYKFKENDSKIKIETLKDDIGMNGKKLNMLKSKIEALKRLSLPNI